MTFKRTLEISGYFFFSILALFTFISKSAVDISGGLILVAAIIYLIRHPESGKTIRNRYMAAWMIPLAIGFITSLFSMSGPIRGASAFLEIFRSFLLVVPFILFIRSEKQIHLLWAVLNLSALVAVIYGATQLPYPHIWVKPIGFHPLLRGSCLYMSVVLINLVVLLSYPVRKGRAGGVLKTLIGINTVLILAAVVLMMKRGVYLGLVTGIFAFLFLIKQKKIILLMVVTICAALYFSHSAIVNQVKTIVDFENNHSNRERIQLFRTGSAYLVDAGLFFRGTGGKMSAEPYKEYFYSHSAEYREENKDIIKRQYFGNFHNSFLQMAVEYGVFFVICFLAGTGCILFNLYRRLPHLPRRQRVYPMAALVVTAGVFVSQFFHTGLYSYSGLPFILALSAGCRLAAGNRIETSGPHMTDAPKDGSET